MSNLILYAQLTDEYHEIRTVLDDYYYGKLIFADTATLSFLTYENLSTGTPFRPMTFLCIARLETRNSMKSFLRKKYEDRCNYSERHEST